MKNTPLVTQEEMALVKEAILLQILSDALERDAPLVESSKLKMRVVYLHIIEEAKKNVSDQILAVRRKLRNAGIKVYEEQRTERGVYVKYLCRGYHHDFQMLWEYAKVETYRTMIGCLSAGQLKVVAQDREI